METNTMNNLEKQIKENYINHLKSLGLPLDLVKKYLLLDILLLQKKEKEAEQLINEIANSLILRGIPIPDELLSKTTLNIMDRFSISIQ